MRCYTDLLNYFTTRQDNLGEELQRANRIYCVRRAERSDSGVRVQRALRIFEKFIHIIPFLVGFLLLYLIFFVLKNGRGAGGEFHFSKLLTKLSLFSLYFDEFVCV
jgi:hypothetical protein